MVARTVCDRKAGVGKVNMDDRLLLTGNEAVALGALHAGALFASAYPGTPSTEIIENFARNEGVYAEWAPNEKVALEAAIGASLGGVRAFAAMKHVGLNVAADPWFTLPYIGVSAGLLVVSADDPGMHSSQNEQDNRYYAKAARVPMLEPSDSQEAYDLTREGFRISERFDTPVLLRLTTRVCHSRSVVVPSPPEPPRLIDYEKDEKKRVMIPGHARLRHPVVLERLSALAEYSESFGLNMLEEGQNRHEFTDGAGGERQKSVLFITSGVAYQYVKEAFPSFPVLKITMSFPLPRKRIKEACSRYENLFVVEELEPYLEEEIRALGFSPVGKVRIPRTGELNPDIVRAAFPELEGKSDEKRDLPFASDGLPGRPPILCAGCPHRGIMYALARLKAIISGDIGCYTLSVLPPLSAHDCQVCMGASITMAHGLSKALDIKSSLKAHSESASAAGGDDENLERLVDAEREGAKGKRSLSSERPRYPVVAAIGDSTFFHMGVTGLMEIAYNRSNCTVVILDNRTTAMTGFQDHPGTGRTLMGKDTVSVDVEMLCKALGIEHVKVVDPYDLEECMRVLYEEMNRPEPSVVISKRPCVLREKSPGRPYYILKENCNSCGLCMRIGCPAVVRRGEDILIVEEQCAGCGLCASICRNDAIRSLDI